MLTSLTNSLPLDLTLVSLLTHLPATRKGTEPDQSESKVSRLYRWRARNPELFEARRIAGMKHSSRVRENLQRIHAECKAEWKASALKNPKLQATERHIAAKDWVLKSPEGQIHCFRNLKKFIRDNPGLFDQSDVQWKHPEGKPNQAWCRAFQSLSRLRPTCFNRLLEWQGWKWCGVLASSTGRIAAASQAQPPTGSVLPLLAA